MSNTAATEVVVLIIEDDPAIVTLLSDVISDLGYRVLTARGADEAIRQLDVIRPNLITLDLGLPGISGRMLIRMLRERPTTRETPIIVISAEMRIEAEIHKLAQLVINKPFDINQLIEAVETTLTRTARQNTVNETK